MSNKTTNIVLAVIVLLVVGAFALYKSHNGRIWNYNNDNKQKMQQEENKNGDNQKTSAKNGPQSGDDYGDPNADIVYYYGRECPHCEKVEKFLEDNDIYKKINFAKKEVWHNKDNGEKLMEAAQKCGINPKKIGVPFVSEKGKCYIGDSDVINFFKSKLK